MLVQVIDAAFLGEARDVAGVPRAGPPEIAIAGRSNVGKSTLLNRLAGRRKLARTSKTPGRTRGIVFFDLALGGERRRSLRLVDLPGYGYAQVSRTEREGWQRLVEGYTRSRSTLALFIVLVDGRRGIEAEERQLLEWLNAAFVPHQVAFTKVDKLSAAERGRLRGRAEGALLVSGETGEGADDLWQAVLAALARSEGRA